MENQLGANVISARDAIDGKTVYLTSCDAWSRDIVVAGLVEEEDTDWRMAFAGRLKEVTDPVLIRVSNAELGLPEPVAA